jgi:Methyltransferase FkbM domain
LEARFTHEAQRCELNLFFWCQSRLRPCCRCQGHTFIDILKIDVEGAEFDALAAFFKAFADEDVLPIGQLQLEIHASANRADFEYFNRWWAALEAAGLRPFYNDPNLVSVNLSRGSRPEVIEVRSFESKR